MCYTSFEWHCYFLCAMLPIMNFTFNHLVEYEFWSMHTKPRNVLAKSAVEDNTSHQRASQGQTGHGVS